MLLKRWMMRRPIQFLVCFGLLGVTMGVVIPWAGSSRPTFPSGTGLGAASEPGSPTAGSERDRALLTISELVRRIEPAVVTIVADGERGEELSQGTGFLFAPRLILTSHSVMDGADGAWIVTHGGMECDVVGVVREDEAHDLVLLEIAEEITDATPVPLAPGQARPGESFVVLGSPLGLEEAVTEGIVAEFRDLEDLGRVLRLSTPLAAGSTGSPVLNRYGEVLGVATRTAGDRDPLEFAVPASRIRAMDIGRSSSLFTRREDYLADRQRESSWLVQSAMESMGVKDWAAGFEAAEAAVKSDPTSVDAWWCRGACLLGLGRPARAKDALLHALVLDPRHQAATVTLARVAFDLGTRRDAQRYALRAELAAWRAPKELLLVAEVFRDLAKEADALRCVRRVLALDPSSPSARDLLADIHFDRGVIAFRARRYAEALTEFTKSIEVGGDDARTHYNLALTQASLRRWHLCILHARQSLEFDPDAARARLQLGEALLETGDIEGAEVQAMLLQELDPLRGKQLHDAVLDRRWRSRR